MLRENIQCHEWHTLSHLRVRDKLDQYLECMDGGTTLRTVARQCGVSLNTSFHLRHRLMTVIENDNYGQLSGIAEEDETFFRESHKGDRSRQVPPRRRGGRTSKRTSGSHKAKKAEPVKIPDGGSL